MKHLKLLFAFFTLILLASCNQGTSTSENGGGSAGGWNLPGVGTTYIYQLTPVESSEPEFDTITVFATGQHLGGKNNVITYSTGSTGNGDTECYAIESNGNFSVSDDETNDSDGFIVQDFDWETYPTGTKQATALAPPVNTVEDSELEVSSDTVTFIGTENTSTPAGEFSTLHLRETSISIDSSLNGNGGFSSNTSTITDYWFAPSAGFFVKVIINDTENGLADPQAELNLFKYSPK